MVYVEKFAVAIKVDGKILRERGDEVFLPFGSSYSILLKNLNTRKAQVGVSIDGEDVLNGRSLLIEANSSVELERYIKNSLDEGNKFKFIHKNQEISEYRGDRIEDGLIRISYRFEKPKEEVTIKRTIYDDEYIKSWWPRPWFPYGGSWIWINDVKYTSNWRLTSNTVGKGTCSDPIVMTSCGGVANQTDGITVPGELSLQKFRYGSIGELEENASVIILRLKGHTPKQEQVQKPLFTNDKITCRTCGRVWSSTHKFCANCGAALVIV
jgi:hypothetical protein